jgi:hypothetical protein
MMNWKGFGRKCSWPNFKVLSRNSRGTEENHESPLSEYMVSGLRLELGTSQIRRNVNHSRSVMTSDTVDIKIAEIIILSNAR